LKRAETRFFFAETDESI